METKANFVAIGLFTLILTAVGFGFVYWIARYDESTPMKPMLVQFEGSVAGLFKGGQVLFNGIKVGEVTDLNYDPDSPQYVTAKLLVDAEIPLKEDSRVELTQQGLTGVGNVEIKGGSPQKPDLLDEADIPELIASSSAMQDLMSGARQILARADGVLAKVERVVDTNEAKINSSIDNVENFTAALNNNAENIDTFLTDASGAAKGLTSLSDRLEKLSDRAETLLAAVDPDSVRKTVANVEKFSGKLASASDQFDTVVADASKAAKGINEFSANLNTSLAKVDKLVGSVDPDAVQSTVKSLNNFATKLDNSSEDIGTVLSEAKEAAGNINTFSKTISARTEDFDHIITDARQAAKGINEFTSKFGTSLEKVDTLVESVDPKAIQSTVKSLNSFATKLDNSSEDFGTVVSEAKEAAGNINKFSKTISARTEDFDHIVTDARQAAKGINDFTSNLGTSLTKVDTLVDSVDAEAVRTAIKSLGTFATALDSSSADIGSVLTEAREAAGNINKFSKTMSSRTEDFDQIVTDAKELAARLNKASKRVDGLLSKVDTFLSDGEGGKGLVNEVTLAARSIRRLSEKFEGRADEIANGLARFSGKGLRDVETMVGEARQTLRRLEGALGKLEDDPSSIIFGGNKVKTYNRRY